MKSRVRFASVKLISEILGYRLTNRSLIKLGIFVSKRINPVGKNEVIHNGETIFVNIYEKTSRLFEVVDQFLNPTKLATVAITAMLEGFKLNKSQEIKLGKYISNIFNKECKVPCGKFEVNAYQDTIEYRETVYSFCLSQMASASQV
ncbi:MAG: hypothetical protein ACRCU6_07130 [Fusobacteriaceae bacterium]